MRRSTSLVTFVVACFFVGLATRSEAADGVELVQKITSGTGGVQTSQFQIEKTRLRGEITDATGATQVVVFDSTKQVVDIINMSQKTYMEMTREDVDRMGAQMQGAMAGMQGAMAGMQAQMAAQMAAMTPEQRAQMEAMMGRRGMAGMAGTASLGAMAAAAKPEYRRGGTSTVARWTCNVYEGFVNGQKTAEVCTVSAATLGFTPADFEVANQLSSFLQRLMPQAANQVAGFGTAANQGFDGLPVRSVTNIGGQQTTTEVTAVTRQTFADSLFTVPAGFQKQDMMGMTGAGPGRGR